MCPSMNSNPQHLTLYIPKPINYNFPTFSAGSAASSTSPRLSMWFDIRLFYVRISPCDAETVPDHLTLRHIPDNPGVSLEINAALIPTSTAATTTLRRDRIDDQSSEVTFVSTDTVRVTGEMEFEIHDVDNLILCGSINKMHLEWCMDCFPANGGGVSSFFRPKMGISSPCFEVYIAGRWGDTPVILTKMVSVSPRRKSPKYSALDSIPEVSDDVEKDCKMVAVSDSLIGYRKLQLTGSDGEYQTEEKLAHSFYPEGIYVDEDGQLSWFNAGVRVGVGIGLGMCLGVGIGAGLLMRSYQATTRNFRRRFL